MDFSKDLEKLKELLKTLGHGLKYDELISELGWSPKSRKEIMDQLNKWVEDGELTFNKKGKYNIPESSGMVKGIFSMGNSGKFAFVDTPTEGIFIHSSNFNSALDGDSVLVRITDEGGNGRKKEGEVVKITARGNDTLTGTFQSNGSYGFVIPTHSIGKDIYIPEGRCNGANDKELVSVKINFWGDDTRKPEGEITEVIGSADDTDNLIKALILREGLSETFPDEAIAQAQNMKNEISEDEIKNRKDLRSLSIITIDGDDARDFDDAVYVEKLPNNNYRLIVAIADVSYYIKQKSPMDQEAYNRGNSVYLVDRVLPMLPKEISNGVCSLNEHEDKLTFSCEMEIDPTGKVVNSDTYKSVINSVHRMTYNNSNKILAGDPEMCTKYSDIKDMLHTMYELSKILREMKHNRGSIDFDIPEINVILDENNKVTGLTTRERGECEKIIEDFMVAANETVAEKLFYLDIPSVYRTHEKPDPDRIRTLNETLNKFHYSIPQVDNIHPKQFQEIIERSKEEGTNLLIHKMILRSLKQARYTTENLGHFGLASKCYTHFTSPIRRYADLEVHRVLAKTLNSYPDEKDKEKNIIGLASICEHISATERIAMKVEEESVKIKVVEYMLDKVNEEFTGIITGFSPKKVFFETEEHVECFWDVVATEDYYEFNEKDYVMINTTKGTVYNLGDKMQIILLRADLHELELEVIPKDLLEKHKW